jgi:hypothetical protein
VDDTPKWHTVEAGRSMLVADGIKHPVRNSTEMAADMSPPREIRERRLTHTLGEAPRRRGSRNSVIIAILIRDIVAHVCEMTVIVGNMFPLNLIYILKPFQPKSCPTSFDDDDDGWRIQVNAELHLEDPEEAS